MKLRRLSALLGALALTFSATSAVLATAPVGHTVPLCHANSDEKNPYILENPDIPQVGYLGDTSGHAGHANDGVWYPGAKADKFNWGDIIPPYDYQPTEDSPVFHYDGLNWTAEGEAIWKNDCVAPVAPAHTPGIHIEKTASLIAVQTPGGPVTYTLDVKSTCNVPLTTVSVSDDKCSPVTFVSGDTNGDSKLDQTESWTYTCTAQITQDTTNIGVATGHDGETTVTDDDTVTVVLVGQQSTQVPAIHLEKTVAPLNLPVGGGNVTFTYVVSNIGDLALTNVSVKD